MSPVTAFLFRAFFVLVASSTVVHQVGAEEPTSASLRYQQALAERVRSVADDVLPSVVGIEVIGVLQSDGEVRQDAPTSGLVIDRDGHVLASSWVTRGPSASIIVTLGTGERFPARVVAEDEHRELTLLKIDPKEADLQPISIDSLEGNDASNPAPKVGATLLALARYGEASVPMISTGVLSAVDRLDGTAVQSDVRISPVFYGGPLLDLRGNLVGVLIPAVGENGAEDPTEWYDSGIAFAVPADVIAKKLERLKAGETIRSGLLGLVVGGADPYAPGTELAAVRKRSPADKAGLLAGDKLLKVGGRIVRRRQEVKLALGRFDAGEEVTIEYERDGETRTTTATLAEAIEPLKPQYLGITSDGTRITSVLPKSPADGILKVGDELKSLDDTPIQDEITLRQRMWSADPQTPIALEIQRESDADIRKEIVPAPWAGPIERLHLDEMTKQQAAQFVVEEETWTSTTLRLPDIVNEALLWSPPLAVEAAGDADAEQVTVAPTALAICLMPPSQRDLAEQLKQWKTVARENRVAICLVASDDEERWQLSEIDAISKLTAAALKRSGASPSAVSVIGLGVLAGRTTDEGKASGPGDSMALAVSLSTDNVYHGVAIPTNTQPPAVRLRRDAPMRLLRVLVTTSPNTELPSWTEILGRLGCPVQTADEIDHAGLMRWCRSLLVY
ncbi:S1C family serine protease [Aporhodopirellula aestuarii]|uniref:PDZ domain-containing protein n=1 Tax=Aporhodopirellula aestuarii TaxID=2950107 RepID=A0ABT0U134_9BACT|nr:PDZ domain-containing protein [Aporhodopirellula aestuarii]MCM2370560.1 PDZ domain-containing protein [Aporhodopirellula aestuarii]